MTDHQRRIEQHEAANLECAQLILADVERYGGEGAGLVIWARMVLDREREKPRQWNLVA